MLRCTNIPQRSIADRCNGFQVLDCISRADEGNLRPNRRPRRPQTPQGRRNGA